MIKTNLSEKIMLKIKSGKVRMRPRFLFVAEKVFLTLGLFLLIVTAIIFVNLTIYIVKNNGAMEFLDFGLDGWEAFWENFPYGFIIWILIFLFLSYLMFKKFDISYKKPSYNFLIIFAVIGLGGGLLLSSTKANESLVKPAKESNIPILRHAYRLASPKGTNFQHGVLVRVEQVGNGYIITKSANGKTLVIKTDNSIGQPNNIVVEGSKADQDFERQLALANQEINQRFNQIILEHHAWVVRLNQIRTQQLENIQKMKFQQGQVLKLTGKQQNGNFQTSNLAPANKQYQFYGTNEN